MRNINNEPISSSVFVFGGFLVLGFSAHICHSMNLFLLPMLDLFVFSLFSIESTLKHRGFHSPLIVIKFGFWPWLLSIIISDFPWPFKMVMLGFKVVQHCHIGLYLLGFPWLSMFILGFS